MPVIHLYDDPTNEEWNSHDEWSLPNLYKFHAGGSVMFWNIKYREGYMHMSHGLVGGEIVTSKTRVELNTSGRNLKEQALLEMRQRYRLKIRVDRYSEDLNSPAQVKGMKGEEYTKGDITSWPVIVQPKLDGVRMLMSKTPQGVLMKSYGNKVYSHLTHIGEEILPFFDYLPASCTIDGELYNHEIDFTQLISIVRTVKHVHKNIKLVKYCIFDLCYPGDPTLEDRVQLLLQAYNRFCEDIEEPKYFYPIESMWAESHEEIMEAHTTFTLQGFEGTMIKKCCNGASKGSTTFKQSLYRQTKCKNILKYKTFTTEEALVIGVEEASGTEEETALLKVIDPRNNEFLVRCRGTFEERKTWLKKPELVVGKQLTIRYQELSVYGVPRFPVGIAIRDYE